MMFAAAHSWFNHNFLFRNMNFAVDEGPIKEFNESLPKIYDMISSATPTWNPEPPEHEKWEPVEPDSPVVWRRVEVDKTKHLYMQISGANTQVKSRTCDYDQQVLNLSESYVRIWVNGEMHDLQPHECMSIPRNAVFKVDWFAPADLFVTFFDFYKK